MLDAKKNFFSKKVVRHCHRLSKEVVNPGGAQGMCGYGPEGHG